jgi:hypothetical protein
MSPHSTLRTLPLILIELLLHKLAIRKTIIAVHAAIPTALRCLRVVACSRIRSAHQIVIWGLVAEGVGVVERLSVGRGVDERFGRLGGCRR